MLKRGILHLRSIATTNQVRWRTKVALQDAENSERMLAWQIHSYGGPEELQLASARMPVITRPNDLLVKVEAASVNPIDIAMSRGYGATVFNVMRKLRNFTNGTKNDLEFPLTLGRDFAGSVVSKGHDIDDNFQIGDEIWGIVPLESQGCHAKYVVVDKSMVRPRPPNLSHIEAASILYCGLTAWSALWITGDIGKIMEMPGKKSILVLGGSGGVGTLAIQLLKAWNQRVVTTCNTDAVTMLDQLGAHVVIDYKSEDADQRVVAEGPYAIILDCANQGVDNIKLKGYPFDTFISLNSPILKNFDEYGLFGGYLRTIMKIYSNAGEAVCGKGWVKWAFFIPSQDGFDTLQTLATKGSITPVIDKVFKFEDLPKAYEHLDQGHARGKIVIDMK